MAQTRFINRNQSLNRVSAAMPAGVEIARPQSPTRIVVADAQALLRQLLRHKICDTSANYEVVGEAEDGEQTLNLVERQHPDLLLLDVEMRLIGRLSGFSRQVAARSPATRTILLTADQEVATAVEAASGGVHGYVPKTTDLNRFFAALSAVLSGAIYADPSLPPRTFHAFLRREASPNLLEKLSRQELQILSFIADGRKNIEIAQDLHIATKTVKNHLTHLFAKLGVSNRFAAMGMFCGTGANISTKPPQRVRKSLNLLVPRAAVAERETSNRRKARTTSGNSL